MLTDPIADMLTRIRNANRAMHESASMPTSDRAAHGQRALGQWSKGKWRTVMIATPHTSGVV